MRNSQLGVGIYYLSGTFLKQHLLGINIFLQCSGCGLIDRALSTPEVRGSNLVIGKIEHLFTVK